MNGKITIVYEKNNQSYTFTPEENMKVSEVVYLMARYFRIPADFGRKSARDCYLLRSETRAKVNNDYILSEICEDGESFVIATQREMDAYYRKPPKQKKARKERAEINAQKRKEEQQAAVEAQKAEPKEEPKPVAEKKKSVAGPVTQKSGSKKKKREAAEKAAENAATEKPSEESAEPEITSEEPKCKNKKSIKKAEKAEKKEQKKGQKSAKSGKTEKPKKMPKEKPEKKAAKPVEKQAVKAQEAEPDPTIIVLGRTKNGRAVEVRRNSITISGRGKMQCISSDSVLSVSSGSFESIKISSSSGDITVKNLENRDEVFRAVCQLISDRNK